MEIQRGNVRLENDLIEQYIPFIRKTTAKVCKRYINTSEDDEYSIALIAFNEAIHQYSPDKGSSFLSFASLVIRRRVIDFIRQEQRRKIPLSIDYHDDDNENMENVAEIHASFHEYHEKQEREYRREEILHLNEQLKAFKISLSDVAKQCPKHQDARENMVKIAKTVVEMEGLRSTLMTKKRLPIKELTKHITMSRKTIERNRKYIIAVSLVLMEDYRYLKDYLKEWLG
ncbi:RNA polymerase sigma-I factor [Bacillus sp. H-16]|uniref:RNA polymerase sigma-I factor n=1 Tax=Alteribacter salitolerans TaxID=2912333 RepID=UPI00196484A6|nr:RNA polymerase sigma-I factor [Alteribacter salitolerans]MBM7094586.1 RNA polymerase sigma-I factor [Alteribacter salitolerans]